MHDRQKTLYLLLITALLLSNSCNLHCNDDFTNTSYSSLRQKNIKIYKSNDIKPNNIFSNNSEDYIFAKKHFTKGVGFAQKELYEEAFDCFLKAAELYHVEAQYNVGAMYEFGRGVKKSFQKAVDWYTLAAIHGDEEAHKSIDRVLQKEEYEIKNNKWWYFQ